MREELVKFYDKEFAFSYSSISRLLYSPSAFYKHYILRDRDDVVDTHLIEGRVLHCLLLEKDEFEKQFIILPNKLPSTNIKKIVDVIYYKYYINLHDDSKNLDDFKNEVLDELEQINLYQSLKTDKQRYEKIINSDTIEYFNYLKKKMNKTVIDQNIYDNAKQKVDVLKQNQVIATLMNLNNDLSENIKIYNEVLLTTSLPNKKYKLQGMLDNVLVDEERKMIFINDLKTTSKPIQDFRESVDYYNYWIQAVIYYQLVIDNFLKNVDDYESWEIYFTFVVVDNYSNVYPFQVSDTTFKNWIDKFFNETVPIIDYHYNSKDYTLPYELAVNNVKL